MRVNLHLGLNIPILPSNPSLDQDYGQYFHNHLIQMIWYRTGAYGIAKPGLIRLRAMAQRELASHGRTLGELWAVEFIRSLTFSYPALQQKIQNQMLTRCQIILHSGRFAP